jgi:hypothetical protein
VIERLLTQRATITHRAAGAGRDAYGNPVDVVTTTEGVPFLVQQIGTGENLDGQDVTRTQTIGFTLPAVALDSGDAVTVAGRTYEVAGDPALVIHPPTGAPHHIEARLERSAG